MVETKLSGSYDLYDGKPPHENTDTSKEAAESIVHGIEHLQALVLEMLSARGSVGATDDEMEVRLGLAHQTVSPRRRELVLKGLVRNSGAKRKTRRDRWATVWVLGFNPTFSTDEKPIVVPDRKEIAAAIEALHDVYAYANKHGYKGHAQDAQAHKVAAWLKRLAKG